MANANRPLIEILREEARQVSPTRWTWAALMDRALYESGVGYYRHKIPQIGKKGDFYTSVSVGNVFGQILGAFIFDRWKNLGRPNLFYVIEQGAHEAALSKDVLQALLECDLQFAEALKYIIIEPGEALRDRQRQTLAEFGSERVIHVSSWEELTAQKVQYGIFLGNELLDAFRVHRVRWQGESWQEAYVEVGAEGKLTWTYDAPSSPEVEQACLALGGDFPEGYLTEVHLAALDWIREVSKSSFAGDLLLFDYGYTEAEYYSPDRVNGTLRRYYEHKTDREVLENLGDCDLTAHVNFTALAREAELLGLQVFEFVEQGRFLTQLVTKFVMDPKNPPDAAWVRQFMTLTHPAHLGHSFRVLGLSRSLSESHALPSSDIARARLGLTEDF